MAGRQLARKRLVIKELLRLTESYVREFQSGILVIYHDTDGALRASGDSSTLSGLKGKKSLVAQIDDILLSSD